MKKKILILILFTIQTVLFAQEKNYFPPPMVMNVGEFQLRMNKLFGDGGLQSQFSYNIITTGNRQGNVLFYWPQDQWASNSLFQIFNPVVLDDNGILDEYGNRQPLISRGAALTNAGATDWAREVRRYRPPIVVVDGIETTAPYQWYVDPNLESEILIEFEDVLPQFGIRSHVKMYGFANENHDDYFIWDATHKFTGEIKLPRNFVENDSLNYLPDQTIRFWWPFGFSFGPTKAGMRMSSTGGWGDESVDDVDGWLVRPSNISTSTARDSLYIGYFIDSDNPNGIKYSNGSNDDTGDPDPETGLLYSYQIPGFTLLHADKSHLDQTDDISQPYSMPHTGIAADFWGDRSASRLKAKYKGEFTLGPFPTLDETPMEKGGMRFITVGPYELTKDSAENRYDSLNFVYAVGAGGIGYDEALNVGRQWIQGEITDEEKNNYILRGVDSLFKNLDHANWAYNKLENGEKIPSPPPPPDIAVNSGPDYITISWSYPNNDYYKDAVSGVDDWYAWRVYRKRGAALVNDPIDQKSAEVWEMIYETQDKNLTSFNDKDVIRGLDYYYAVTAVDNGSQNTDGLNPGEKLESSRFANRSQLPVTSFKPGLSTSDMVRVVPNPATSAAGAALNAGNPDKISFFNLPYKCTLRIFTETGDLINTILHIGTADEDWNQRTESNQYVTSGIYVLAVTEAESVDGKQLDNQFVKFVIVR